MSTPPVVFLEIGEYQATRLWDALENLAWCNYHPDFVAHQARNWGATPDEAQAIVNHLLLERNTDAPA